MLPRLSSSLPSATISSAKSATLHVQRACIRFNSSEAVQPSEPKRRGVPLAQNLGDINIRTRIRTRADVLRRHGQGQEGGSPTGQQRQYVDPRDRQLNRVTGGQRAEQRRPQDGQRQSRPPRTRDKAGDEGAEQKTTPKERVERPSVTIPKPAEVELGNLDELFGSHAIPSSSQAVSASPLKDVTPSQARVQLLLEKTAGDYSRYVPRPFLTTDVRKLGPVKLGEFVLSRKRDTGLTARRNILIVVEKFAGGKGARAS